MGELVSCTCVRPSVFLTAVDSFFSFLPAASVDGWSSSFTELLARSFFTRLSEGMNKLLSGLQGLLGPSFRGRYSHASLSSFPSWTQKPFFRHLASSTVDGEPAVLNKAADVASKQGGDEGSNQSGPAGKPVRGGGGKQKLHREKTRKAGCCPVSWLSLLLLILTGGGIIVYYDKEKKRHIEELKVSSTATKPGPSVGMAAIGGPFKLIDHDGKPVTEKDFVGKWTLIYFGFTHCPDICPDELQKLAAAVDKIKSVAGIEIVPIFISVDPERDTVEQINDYVKEFHPNLIGLTGTNEAVREAARAYRVYYMKTEEEGSDYLVDHSIVMYLMNPKMEFTKFFGKNYDVDALSEGIIKEVKQWKK
ncbi:unnamed protein product [Spirodela intermedia]|uniref:Thioredoxin domain-containing protein n=1 Tax=Spirodela intermedia TaxID=51605 RepID=A0A7I8J2M7_SPIIN|nr:unnamed protein product [Spirodela intermedia]CAA6663651.1 unnamed protein product [Spirodela intermedia]